MLVAHTNPSHCLMGDTNIHTAGSRKMYRGDMLDSLSAFADYKGCWDREKEEVRIPSRAEMFGI